MNRQPPVEEQMDFEALGNLKFSRDPTTNLGDVRWSEPFFVAIERDDSLIVAELHQVGSSKESDVL